MTEQKAALKRVFLSYTAGDAPFGQELAAALKQAGVTVVDPAHGVGRGDPWSDQILNLLRTADFFVFVLPKSGLETSWQLSELGAARALGKPIVPVMREQAWYATGAIASRLSGDTALDASSVPLDQLARAIVSRGTEPLAA